MTQPASDSVNRRDFLLSSLRGSALLALGGVVGLLVDRVAATETVWQIDPTKCIMCGRCATKCVLGPSAVKCVHSYEMCGYCDLCTGFFKADAADLNEGAENQLCPVGAVKRRFIEEPYFEYDIDESLCIGCGKCVAGCAAFGNGSLYLQIRHDRCANCNDCSIARECPSDAISRVSADQPYLLKNTGNS